MPEPLHAPLPAPPDRRPPSDDDAPDGSDDLLDDVEDLADDDLDLDWPDDEPLPEDYEPEVAAAEEPALDDVDDDPDEALEIEPEADLPDDDLSDELVVLPWQTTADVDGRALPAILDPTRARTVWIGGAAGRVRVRVGGIEVEVEVDAEAGEPGLRIGRDVLGGRILVGS